MGNESRKPIAYLIMGFICSGKTTYAKKLEKKTHSIRITKDEWLIKLIGNDPTVADFEDLDNRITDLSMDIALLLLSNGLDVIIDDGFWVRNQRDDIRNKIKQIGATYQLHYVQCSENLMRKRVEKRNFLLGKENFYVNGAIFDKYWNYFDDIEADEECIFIKNNWNWKQQ